MLISLCPKKFRDFISAKHLHQFNNGLSMYVCMEDIFWPVQSRGCPSNIKQTSYLHPPSIYLKPVKSQLLRTCPIKNTLEQNPLACLRLLLRDAERRKRIKKSENLTLKDHINIVTGDKGDKRIAFTLSNNKERAMQLLGPSNYSAVLKELDTKLEKFQKQTGH